MMRVVISRRTWPLLALGALLLLLALALPRLATSAGGTDVVLSFESYATGLNSPVAITSAGDPRLFVVQQGGLIRIVDANGDVLGTPFLDLTDRVDSGNEKGLLGLAFDPDYDLNGAFYVQYTYCSTSSCPSSGSTANLYTRVSRFLVTGDPNIANPDSEVIILEVQQPYANHNAGDIAFGSDGYLYIPLGDGGSAGDPGNRAQDLGELLGKILRIDVAATNLQAAPDCDPDGNYNIPADNPFIGISGACDEIWAYGLRNPWRFSFDRNTGDMWVGDVGQNAWEEVNFQPVTSTGGENYGWDCWEGTHTYNGGAHCPIDAGDVVMPVYDYAHNASGGIVVVGGYVYRGALYPYLSGHYIFADYGFGNWWTLVSDGGGGWILTSLGNLSVSNPVAFGQDENGELYVASLSNGVIYHIAESRPDYPFDIYAPVILKP